MINKDNIDLKSMNERELHPFLVHYLSEKMNIRAKTIYHEISLKGNRGRNEWLHPDIVGFDLPVENLDEKVVELCGKFSISRATLYSFELKKSINIDSLREQFFQTVSNSSWANEGYLVAVDIDVTNSELMQEINRLSSAFSIGVIKLNIENPELSEILIPARRKESLDAETMNKLVTINSNFKDFVQLVLNSININSVVPTGLDKVLSKEELKCMLQVYQIRNSSAKENNEKVSVENKNLKNQSELRYTSLIESTIKNNKAYGINNNFTGTTPSALKVEDQIYEVHSWKEVYLQVCKHLIDKDKDKFIELQELVKGKKRPYFTKNKNELRAPYYIDSVGIYAEINLSASSLIRIIVALIKHYNISEDLICVYINDGYKN